MKKNHNTAVIAAVAVLSIALLSGCRELPGKEAADKQLEQSFSRASRQDTAETVKQELSEVTSNVEQAVQNTAAKMTEEFHSSSTAKELKITQRAGDSSVFILENSAGEVKVTSGSSEFITVKATVVAYHNAMLDTDRQILDKAEITIQPDGDSLKVSTHAKNEPAKDLWAWAQKKFGTSNFSINYDIELPANINEYHISNNVGAIQLHGLQGTFHIASSVGAIHLEDAEFSGKSTFESNTGSIGLNISGISSGSSLKASSDIGKITAELDSSLKCTVSAKSELGLITGTGAGKTDFNGGGPLLSLSTQIGSITVQQ